MKQSPYLYNLIVILIYSLSFNSPTLKISLVIKYIYIYILFSYSYGFFLGLNINIISSRQYLGILKLNNVLFLGKKRLLGIFMVSCFIIYVYSIDDPSPLLEYNFLKNVSLLD